MKKLQEMLELNEVSVAKSFMKGYNNAKHRQNRVRQHLAQDARAEKEAQRAAQDAEREAAGAAEREATQSAESSAAEARQAVKDDMDEYLARFFEQFPYLDGGNESERLLEKYPSKEARELGQQAFRTLARRVNELRKGFNRSIVASNMATYQQIEQYNDEAKRQMAAGAPAPHKKLVLFVKRESRFFRNLMKVGPNSELNDRDFKTMIQLKIKRTAPERVPDAVRAMNLLFGYMYSEFNKHAVAIGKVVDRTNAADRRTRDAAEDEARRARIAARSNQS